ncbi:MAG: FAD:protein FMN transferase [Pseudomonadota bacterium]
MRHPLIALALLLLTACAEKTHPPQVYKYTFFSMGTQIDLSLFDVDPARSEQIATAIERDFTALNTAWNPWGNGDLGQLNTALKKNQPATVNQALQELIENARILARDSDGLFNPGVGGLVTLWGFNEAATQMPSGPPPTQAALDVWLKRHDSLANLKIQNLTLSGHKPGLILDFGGYAKGYAVDKAIQHLTDLGVKNAIVNAGGDLRAIGSKGGRPWMIGIRDPRGPGMLAALPVRDGEAVFTSGDYERFYEYQGHRYHHIFDPRTGYPTQETASVTVVYNAGAKADASATALMVAGPQHWQSTAKRLGVRQIMLVATDGTVYITSALQTRIQFEKSPAKLIVGDVDAH